ncbi:MAG TPA: lasso peptide biosynthesis B2 protein [Longimicrobiaceae bacterium]|nr:lasso peptide biosynthesis B2 protein [Longimicrobiaceae bacterium]
MMRVAGAVLAGAGAALAAPWWIEGPRLAELLGPPTPRTPAAVPRGALGAAMRLLSLLSRLPRSPWRNTCLFRSVAECLVLRRYGVPALLCIGVRSEGEAGAVEAHAWVGRAGEPPAGAPASRGHVPLSLRA